MELFLGYDPGGEGKHGVVSVRIARDGTHCDMEADRLADATNVRAWLRERPTAVALGIDTLLAWSWSGSRPCDNRLRKRYDKATFKASDCIYREPDCVYCENGLNELHRAADKRRTSDSVVAQNSLYSAMTLNGALVAMAAREDRPEFPVFESHPKLLLRAAEGIGAAREHLVKGYSEALHEGKPHWVRKERHEVHEDHMADAFVAAWCASRWHFKQWTTDLYGPTPCEDYHFPAGPAVYPWPEPVGAS